MELLLLAPILLLVGILPLFNGRDDDDDEDNGPPDPEILTDGEDIANGGPDPDTIFARDGDDRVEGGRGDDALHGEGGDDTLAGQDGDDVLFGGAGDDHAQGDDGDDRIFLGDGNDVTSTTAPHHHSHGDDLIRGGAGNDMIRDWVGGNTLYGDLGNDRLDSRDGYPYGTAPWPWEPPPHAPDTVFGGYGSDALLGDAGDTLTGGAGRDIFGVDIGNAGAARITDLADDEVLVIYDNRDGDQPPATTRLAESGEDLEVVIGDEVVAVIEGRTEIADWQLRAEGDVDVLGTGSQGLGTGGDDTIRLWATGVRAYGLEGDDDIRGSGMADILSGGAGEDRIHAVGGNDGLLGGDGDDLLNGGAGRDVIFGEDGDDILDGRDQDTGTANRLYGGEGDDRLYGEATDSLWGEAGSDTFIHDGTAGLASGQVLSIADYEPGVDVLELTLPAGAGDPALTVTADPPGSTTVSLDGQPVLRLFGIDAETFDPSVIRLVREDADPAPGYRDDTWTGSEGDDSVLGLGGDDSLSGLGGDDFLAGNEGADSIAGGAGDDRIAAGNGDDSVSGDEGDDHVLLGDGDDSYRGQAFVAWGDPVPDSGDDVVRGGNGNDSIWERNGADTLYGDLGNDSLSAVDGLTDPAGAADVIYGGYGMDELSGDNGDTLFGGAGGDMFVVDDYIGNDEPVVIADLGPGDGIFIVGGFNMGPDDNDEPQFQIAENGEDTEIIANGVAVIVKGRIDFQNFNVTLGHT